MEGLGVSSCVLGIPVKVNIDSGGKPNGVPERRLTAVGAKRRWRDDCAGSVRHRQLKTSGAERRLGLSGDLGCRGKGRQPLCPCFLGRRRDSGGALPTQAVT